MKEWIADEEEANQEFLGHNRFAYDNPNREIYWVRFKSSLDKAFFARNSAKSGLPYCLTERMFDYNLMEVNERTCPSMKTDDTAQLGMTVKFLNDLGIYDERYYTNDVALRFYISIVYWSIIDLLMILI